MTTIIAPEDTVIAHLDFDPDVPCDYHDHGKRVHSDEAAVLSVLWAADCCLPERQRYYCDPCWEYLNSRGGLMRCTRCGGVLTMRDCLIKVERIR